MQYGDKIKRPVSDFWKSYLLNIIKSSYRYLMHTYKFYRSSFETNIMKNKKKNMISMMMMSGKTLRILIILNIDDADNDDDDT